MRVAIIGTLIELPTAEQNNGYNGDQIVALTLQVHRATLVAQGIYSRSASGDYSSPSVEVTVYFH